MLLGCKCHLIGSSGTAFVDSAMGTNLFTALLATSIVELGIKRTKGPPGLGTENTLNSFFIRRLKYIRSAIFCR